MRIGTGGVAVEPIEEEAEVLFEVAFGWLDAYYIAVGSGEAGFFAEFLHEGGIDLDVEAADLRLFVRVEREREGEDAEAVDLACVTFQEDALEGAWESIEGGHHNAFMDSGFHGDALDHLTACELAVGGELREELMVGELVEAIFSFVHIGKFLYVVVEHNVSEFGTNISKLAMMVSKFGTGEEYGCKVSAFSSHLQELSHRSCYDVRPFVATALFLPFFWS